MRVLVLMALVAGMVGAEEAKKEVKTKVVQTPFGPSLRAVKEESNGTARRALKDDPMLKIEESGDTVTFKRRTPFGEQVWRKKRSELTDLEKEMMEARRAAPLPSDKPGDKR